MGGEKHAEFQKTGSWISQNRNPTSFCQNHAYLTIKHTNRKYSVYCLFFTPRSSTIVIDQCDFVIYRPEKITQLGWLEQGGIIYFISLDPDIQDNDFA